MMAEGLAEINGETSLAATRDPISKRDSQKMVAKLPTVDAIAITEKKMDMTLDEIISTSKKGSAKGKLPHRAPIKIRGFENGRPPPKGFKARQYNDSRSAVRQSLEEETKARYEKATFVFNICN